MRNLYIIFVFSILTSFLFSCSSDPKPTSSQIQKSLEMDMPAYVSKNDFNIEASQNAGTKVEPIYQARFKASFKLKTDTFVYDHNDNDVLFVKPYKNENYIFEVFGKSESRLYAGEWKTKISFEGFPLESVGKPLSMFSGSRVIVSGSDAEKTYFDEINRIKKEKEEAELKAAEERANLSSRMKSKLPGTWKNDTGFTFTYVNDGSFSASSEKGEKYKGKWDVNNGNLTLIEDQDKFIL